MSAMIQTVDFAAKADELTAAYYGAIEAADRLEGLLKEIASAAVDDDCGGLARFGFAVAGEAQSLAGVFHDAQLSRELRYQERDVRDLVELIRFALAKQADDA